MICPECRTEYRDGFFTCADCDRALVAAETIGSLESEDLYEQGHLNPDGPLHSTHDSLFLADLVEAIEAAGIPYAFEAGSALDLLAGGEVEDFAGTWEARIYVHRAHRTRARGILEELLARPPQGPLSE